MLTPSLTLCRRLIHVVGLFIDCVLRSFVSVCIGMYLYSCTCVCVGALRHRGDNKGKSRNDTDSSDPDDSDSDTDVRTHAKGQYMLWHLLVAVLVAFIVGHFL